MLEEGWKKMNYKEIIDYLEWRSELHAVEYLEQIAFELVQEITPTGFWVDSDGPWLSEGQIISRSFATNVNQIFLYILKVLENK